MATARFPNLAPDQLGALEGIESDPSLFDSSEIDALHSVSETELEDGSVEIEFGTEDLSLPELVAATEHNANLAEFIPDDVLETIGADLVDQVEQDDRDRDEWKQATRDSIQLLGLKLTEDGDLPFEGAADVTHPLLLEAVVKFQARAYAELFPSKGPVKTQIMGTATPARIQQSARVKDFMNYQVQHEIPEYGPETDRLLFLTGLFGTAFRKSYVDPTLGRPTVMAIRADDLIVPYNTTNLDTAPRYTHKLKMNKNDLLIYQRDGFYRQTDIGLPSDPEPSELQEEIDEIEGKSPTNPADEIFTLYEIYVRYNLPGFEDVDEEGTETGVGLPYIITVEKDSGKILAIRRNWDEADPLKRPLSYITKYDLVPGLGFYGYGYLHLIGGLARAATANLRQLIDAGTFNNLPAGFKAFGLRVIGDNAPFRPGEFRDIQAPIQDIQRAIFPLPFKEPSPTSFQLLQFVVQAAEKFADSTDSLVSEAQTYGPMGTIMALLEQGGRLFSAIHKRLHHAQAQDFKILSRLNYEYLPDEYPYEVYGADRTVFKEDFDGRIDVIPVSDPNLPTQAHRIAKANAIFSMAIQDPQNHDMREVVRYLYESMDVENPDRFLKKQPPEAQPLDPISENVNALQGQPLRVGDHQNHVAHIKTHMAFLEIPTTKQNPLALQALAAHITEHIAADYRVQMSKALGINLQLGQPMPPEVENQIAVKAAEATEQLMNGEISRLMAEKMEDPEIQVLFEGLHLQKQKQDNDFIIDIARLALEEWKARVDDENKDADRDLEARKLGAQTQLAVYKTKVDSNNKDKANALKAQQGRQKQASKQKE